MYAGISGKVKNPKSELSCGYRFRRNEILVFPRTYHSYDLRIDCFCQDAPASSYVVDHLKRFARLQQLTQILQTSFKVALLISFPLRSATGSMKSKPTQHCRSLRMKSSSCSELGTSEYKMLVTLSLVRVPFKRLCSRQLVKIYCMHFLKAITVFPNCWGNHTTYKRLCTERNLSAFRISKPLPDVAR